MNKIFKNLLISSSLLIMISACTSHKHTKLLPDNRQLSLSEMSQACKLSPVRPTTPEDAQIQCMKKLADQGQVTAIYLTGTHLLTFGRELDDEDLVEEGTGYLKLAAIQEVSKFFSDSALKILYFGKTPEEQKEIAKDLIDLQGEIYPDQK